MYSASMHVARSVSTCTAAVQYSMAEGIEATCVEHESGEEVSDREADDTDSDGREPSSRSKMTIFWSFSVQNEVQQKMAKRVALRFTSAWKSA